MSVWLDARVREVRRRLTSDDEGSLWVLFLDRPGGEVIIAAVFDRAMADLDPEVIRNLGHLIAVVSAPATLLIVPRADGAPHAMDAELLRQLERAEVASTECVDLIVVGAVGYWTARHGAPPTDQSRAVG